MATATPSSRWRESAGWRSLRSWNRCLTDVAGRSKSATPPVMWARLPTSTTFAKGVLVGAAVGALAVGGALEHAGLVEPLLPQRLEHLGRRHRQLGEADACGLLH